MRLLLTKPIQPTNQPSKFHLFYKCSIHSESVLKYKITNWVKSLCKKFVNLTNVMIL